MKAICHDSFGHLIHREGEYYFWRCENGWWSVHKNSAVPIEPGEFVTFLYGFKEVRRYARAIREENGRR